MTYYPVVCSRLGSGEVDLRPEPATLKGVRVPKAWKCAHWDPATRTACGQDAGLYTCGPRCQSHSPAAMSGHAIPVPDPQWTAAAFRARARTTTDPLAHLPETCDHDEPKGPRYCALCRRIARKAHL